MKTYLGIPRIVLVIFIIVSAHSCERKENITEKSDPESLFFTEHVPVEQAQNNQSSGTQSEFVSYKDSLRNDILSHKDNTVLKGSFLEEFYIRNVVRVNGDSLYATISFDLHGPDCGAPDCFTTEVSFHFFLGDSLVFPDKLAFQEFESGCVENESKLNGLFQRTEQTDQYVIYHCSSYHRTMVLFSTLAETETSAYYFTQVNRKDINGKNVLTITEQYEASENSHYPFTSSVLSTCEYELFYPLPPETKPVIYTTNKQLLYVK